MSLLPGAHSPGCLRSPRLLTSALPARRPPRKAPPRKAQVRPAWGPPVTGGPSPAVASAGCSFLVSLPDFGVSWFWGTEPRATLT